MQSTKKQDIRSSYDTLSAKIYDIRYKEEQKAKYNVILDKVTICDEQLTLDDGCGTGLFMNMLDGYIVGLDLSTKLLTSALLKLRNRTHTYLLLADSDFKPIRYRIFHKVFSVTVLQNLPIPSTTINEIKRVSRPHSQIVITALKKKFSLEHFRKILKTSNFSEIEILENENFNDWMAFVINEM
jgi:ubiquinone/menaquinone biosynthesis C-methylase UbiE